jgi:hypothetical protein
VIRRTLWAGALLLALWALPALAGMDLCGFHRITHLPCPLCGLTRSLFALVKGNWGEAVRLHALSPLALAMLLAAPWEHPWRNRLWGVGLAAFAVYGVARMAMA